LGAVSASPDPHDPSACTACRGTGEVVSNLGGTAHRVPCPWCDGSGRFLPEHDAQAAGPADRA
jgi:DnaJ-class molecular chaperone